jgi:hypothetical protein
MAKTFDIYCVEAADLAVAQGIVAQALARPLVLHDSMYWGGDYYMVKNPELRSLQIR